MEIPNNWTFKDQGVAAGFESHVREQLPWYELITGAVAHIARHYIPDHGLVYDIGCSTGNIGNALLDTIDARNVNFIGIENSKHMASLYRGPGIVINSDAIDYDYKNFDLAVMFLVLMFMPVAKRAEFVSKMYAKLNVGGAIIIVDKCLPTSGYPSIILSRLALWGKAQQKVNPDYIIKKELSLSGVQRPVNPVILGKNAVEFFRFGDFAGYIIEKKE